MDHSIPFLLCFAVSGAAILAVALGIVWTFVKPRRSPAAVYSHYSTSDRCKLGSLEKGISDPSKTYSGGFVCPSMEVISQVPPVLIRAHISSATFDSQERPHIVIATPTLQTPQAAVLAKGI
ncbi:hypothetical protein BASA50_002366 [Batrachochytrium salamandrivorans]|uniref:Secreted protein n=1 Tax=Batrachochytrium salamandrivorans TaxID=1357716 RepID=A0ABQ8FLJ5_9FUNG|nr:hypothetical protein BASA60_010756 [Batrachochytrium salamandrivorans]KAH6569601.1 hypothetical protein BASA62_004767 [Batrachochytrium salamandrivorans]KAH6580049.1 hypothetical protein BASA61_009861 [Batrachochytrium salamandrivorans]KAH6600355.1 hypothetical protein BASA50_002366 [Batrachochytrium salamandrivorans]KAH9254539.1 hypothetical protein BASA81_007481 [Batrachochytrium salamandrivorans]